MAVSQYQPGGDMFGNLFEEFLRPRNRTGGGYGLLRAPEADVMETEKDILVLMDVPGSAREDIEIVLENNILTVSGERRPQWDENTRANFHLAERRYGRFSRSFVLPRDVDQERIEADFENGVLTVTIPKSEKARRRRIEIGGGSRSDGRSLEDTTEVH